MASKTGSWQGEKNHHEEQDAHEAAASESGIWFPRDVIRLFCDNESSAPRKQLPVFDASEEGFRRQNPVVGMDEKNLPRRAGAASKTGSVGQKIFGDATHMQTIQIEKLRKEFGTLVAVNDISLAVDAGNIVGLIAPNGAGKTTVLRMLATLTSPTDGHATLLGLDLRDDYLAIRNRVGYLPDFFNLYLDLTLRECLAFFAQAYAVPEAEAPARIQEALDFVDLAERSDAMVSHLSRGMVQRFGLATLLVRKPDILLLDEPASGLDPLARAQLRTVLKKLGSDGCTVIISSHILPELADFCTHIALLDHGKLVVHGEINAVRLAVSTRRRLEIAVLDDPAQAAELVSRQRGFTIVATAGNLLHIETDATQEALAALNTALVNGGVRVVRFAEQPLSIEDVFLQMTTGPASKEEFSNVE